MRRANVVVPGHAPCIHFSVDGVRNHRPGTPCGHLVWRDGVLYLVCIECGAHVELALSMSFEKPPALAAVPPKGDRP